MAGETFKYQDLHLTAEALPDELALPSQNLCVL